MAGLSSRNRESAQGGLRNTLFAVCIEEVEKPGIAIGMGRLIGDGGTAVQITDIAVVPRCQKQGLGEMIIKEILAYIRGTLHPSVFVNLISDRDARAFYGKFGFIERAVDEPAMILQR